MSNICQIYVIIEVHTHHFFTIYTQSHKYISVSMLSSLTHPPSKSTLRICGTSVDSPIHDMVSVCVGVIPVAHEAKMLYCITDTVRRTSFWTPSRACRKGETKKEDTNRSYLIHLIFVEFVWSFLIFFYIFWSHGWSVHPFLTKPWPTKADMEAAGGIFSPRNGLQHARAIRFLRRTLFATYFQNISWHSLWHIGSSHVQTILYPPTFAICCSCRA